MKFSSATRLAIDERGGKVSWLLCVCFSVIPLLIFLATLEIITTYHSFGDIVLLDEFSQANINVKLNASHFKLSLFNYSIFIFLHVCVCTTIGWFFVRKLKMLDSFVFSFILCLVFSATVIWLVYFVTYEQTAFKTYMVDPVIKILTVSGIAADNGLSQSQLVDYISLCLLFPTGLGIIVVVFATGTSHAMVFFKMKEKNIQVEQDFDFLVTSFRTDMTLLSVILVSAVVTAKMFFTIPSHLLLYASAESEFYKNLVFSVSTGSGLLFTLTLIAAFLPKLIFLIYVQKDTTDLRLKIQKIFRESSNGQGQGEVKARSFIQPIMAILAPTLVNPFMELFFNFSM